MVKNTAFVFVKPHANNDKVATMVRKDFEERKFAILTEGTIDAATIDEKKLVDQHYYAIASKATLLKPSELNIPADKFKAKFGKEWKDVLDAGNAYNALDACSFLGIDANRLDSEWAKAKKADKLVKLGGGFYCGLIELAGKPSIFVFNGFFMSMRSKFVTPGVSIHYYVVEWDSADCSWEKFRAEVLGPTDPADAPASSLRGRIYREYKQLGLASQPNVGDNGIHASASPFEALAERMNWLGASLRDDSFGRLLLDAGISEKTINEWSVDPQVTYGPIPIKKSLFDSLEDLDTDECLARCTMLNVGSGKKCSAPCALPVPCASAGALAVGMFIGAGLACIIRARCCHK